MIITKGYGEGDMTIVTQGYGGWYGAVVDGIREYIRGNSYLTRIISGVSRLSLINDI